jgi:hypothetical protein
MARRPASLSCVEDTDPFGDVRSPTVAVSRTPLPLPLTPLTGSSVRPVPSLPGRMVLASILDLTLTCRPAALNSSGLCIFGRGLW